MSHPQHQVLDIQNHEHPRVLFFLACLCFFVGIAGSTGGWSSWLQLLVYLFPCICILLIPVRRIGAIITILGVTALGMLIGERTYSQHQQNIHSFESIVESAGWALRISGTIDKKLYTTELSQAYRLSIDNFDNISTQSVDIGDGREISILVEIPKNLTISVWERISIEWKPKSLYSGELDGFEKYSFLHNLSAKISAPVFTRISTREATPLEHVGYLSEQHIFRGFPRDVAGVILGMTIGNVELMSKDIQESFRISWISHILVVSGSNITFLIVLLSGILRYFPIGKWIRIGGIFVFVLLYSTLVGWDVPVIRSTIMGLVAFFVIEQGSRISSLALLCLIGVIFLIFSPLSLLYDPAFWLSFAATMSIILYYKPLHIRSKRLGIPSWLWSIFAITLAASLGTLPVTVYHFGTISLGFLFANIAIAMIVWWILFIAVWYLLLGFLWETFLYFFGFLLYVPVNYIIMVSRFFGAWWVWEVPEDIGNILIVSSIAFFCFEFFRVEKIFPQKAQKIHDSQ